MAVVAVFVDETFDSGSMPAGWSTLGSPVVSTTKPGTGTHSLAVPGRTAGAGVPSYYAQTGVLAGDHAFREWCCGFHLWVDDVADWTASEEGYVATYHDDNDNAIMFTILSTGAVRMKKSSGTSVANFHWPNRFSIPSATDSATGLVTAGWNHFEFGSKFADSSLTWLKVNEVTALNLTGDTQNLTPTLNRKFAFYGPRDATKTAYFDNVYIFTNNGGLGAGEAHGEARALNTLNQDGSAFQEWFDLAEIASAHDLTELDTRAAYLKVRGNT